MVLATTLPLGGPSNASSAMSRVEPDTPVSVVVGRGQPTTPIINTQVYINYDSSHVTVFATGRNLQSSVNQSSEANVAQPSTLSHAEGAED